MLTGSSTLSDHVLLCVFIAEEVKGAPMQSGRETHTLKQNVRKQKILISTFLKPRNQVLYLFGSSFLNFWYICKTAKSVYPRSIYKQQDFNNMSTDRIYIKDDMPVSFHQNCSHLTFNHT